VHKALQCGCEVKRGEVQSVRRVLCCVVLCCVQLWCGVKCAGTRNKRDTTHLDAADWAARPRTSSVAPWLHASDRTPRVVATRRSDCNNWGRDWAARSSFDGCRPRPQRTHCLALRRDIFSHHLSRWISPRNEMGNCLQHRLRRRRQDRLIAPSARHEKGS
jgi:hypothetical protein